MKIHYSNNELAEIQVKNEIAMKTAGVDRFHLNNSRAIAEGSASDTNWNKRIIQELVSPLAYAIDIYLDYYKGRRGKPSRTLTYLKLLPSEQAAYITIKNLLDSLTRETYAYTVAKTIGSRIEDQVRFAGVEEAAPKYIEKVQKQLARANSKQYKHRQAALAGASRSLMRGNPNKDIEAKPELGWTPWPEQDLLQLGSQLINIFADNILFEGQPVIYKRVVVKPSSRETFLSPTEHMEKWIERYKDTMEALSPAFAPCVIPPRDWKSPVCGGYHIREIADTLPLVKCRRSQRKRLTKKQMPEVYEAINTLQQVPWTVNSRVLEVVQEVIRLGLPYGVPSRDPVIFPESPLGEEYEGVGGKDLKKIMPPDEWKEFLQWKTDTTRLHSLNNKRKAELIKLSRILSGARQFSKFENIYFVYTMDFRGRVYCKSDSITPQGEDIQKGLINFAKGVRLGKSGYKWLAVHGANVWGEDKLTFEGRIKHIEDNEDLIRDIAADPLTFTEWAAADKPYAFLNWCFEWADLMDWIEDGKAVEDFKSHTPCAMDGSCSGLQHYSAILRDPVGGAAVNLIPSDKPQDIYNEAALLSVETFKEMAKNGEDELERQIGQGWLDILGGVTRGLHKPPVMTYTYGSTRIRCLDTTGAYLVELQEKEDMKAKAQGREPVKVHGFAEKRGEPGPPKFEAEKVGAGVVWDSTNKTVVGAKTGMHFIQQIAKHMAKGQKHFEIITPTGFIVEQREMDYTSRRVKTQLLGQTYMSLTEETLEYNLLKMKSSSAPNFIHSMDASHLIKAVNAIRGEGIKSIAVIHDSFGTHAGHTDTLREKLLETFVEMYKKNDVLSDLFELNESILCKELPLEVPEQMGLDLDVVLDAQYCFA